MTQTQLEKSDQIPDDLDIRLAIHLLTGKGDWRCISAESTTDKEGNFSKYFCFTRKNCDVCYDIYNIYANIWVGNGRFLLQLED